MANPYMLPGFQQGFLQGIDVVYRQKDHEFNTKAKELELERARVGLESDKEETTRAREKYDYEKGLRPMQEKQFGLQMAATNEQIAASRTNREKIDFDLQQRKRLAGAQEADVYHKRVTELGPRVGKLIRNEQWLADGEAIDAALNYGMVGDPNKIGDLKNSGIRWLNQTFAPEINKGVGEEVDAATAKQLGIAPGTKITSKEIVDFYSDGKDLVIELKVNTLTPDNQVFSYNAPATKNRSSSQSDEILHIPISRVEKFAGAAGNFSQAAKLIRKEDPNATLDDIGNAIEATLAGTQKQISPDKRYKVTKDGLFDTVTKNIVDLPKGINPDNMMKRIDSIYQVYATEVGAENVDMDTVIAKAKEMEAAALGRTNTPQGNGKLTKEQIGEMYARGEISRGTAKELLIKNGYGE